MVNGISRDGMSAPVAAAIDANRIDLYLQPIVTLPQRKVRYYEALSRMRTEEGDVVPAVEFIEVAESAGLMPKLDNLLMFRCVQVMRRLQMKNRDVGLFCNSAPRPCRTPTYFRQFLDFMDANRVLGPSMMLEFTHAAYRGFGPLEHEALASLAERGFRFSLDHVTDLRLEPKELADRGFRFVKVPAKMLLSRITGAVSDIHPADLADLLARSGIDLIAERDRERKHGGRSARLRRALRPGLPVLAAAAGARRGAANGRGREAANGGRGGERPHGRRRYHRLSAFDRPPQGGGRAPECNEGARVAVIFLSASFDVLTPSLPPFQGKLSP